jgi:hypothetical protein
VLTRGGQEVPTAWRDVQVGDVVKVKQDEVGPPHLELAGHTASAHPLLQQRYAVLYGVPLVKMQRSTVSGALTAMQDSLRMWHACNLGSFSGLRLQEVPADLLFLSTSDELGVCHVETANLDGETNLKLKNCLQRTAHAHTADQLVDFEERWVLEQHSSGRQSPSCHLYKEGRTGEPRQITDSPTH